MEIEHVNEDTIRVRIDNNDLEDRGYTFLDLLGNQKQIEKFFYSILEEVDLDDEFKDSEAVTFQVMPNPNGLDLLISKNQEIHNNIAANTEAGLKDLYLNQEDDKTSIDEYSEENEDKDKVSKINEDKNIVIKFNNFEQIIQLAQNEQTINGFSNLYLYKENYFVAFQLIRDDYSLRTFEEKLGIILEFGEQTRIDSDVLDEHGDLLIENNALEEILHYFK